MICSHPLDRPAWGALTTGQAHLALGDHNAVAFPPDIGPFAAACDESAEAQSALSALVSRPGGAALVESIPPPEPGGARVVSRAVLYQMVAGPMAPDGDPFNIVPLSDGHAAEMWALATLTKPGPFQARTHVLGDFFGVFRGGVLAAMAGERMKPKGFTEVSAVCTHPDHRGQGYGAALAAYVCRRIQARGETAFLHVYPHNIAAISVYEALGFRLRREMTLTILARSH